MLNLLKNTKGFIECDELKFVFNPLTFYAMIDKASGGMIEFEGDDKTFFSLEELLYLGLNLRDKKVKVVNDYVMFDNKSYRAKTGISIEDAIISEFNRMKIKEIRPVRKDVGNGMETWWEVRHA